MSDFETTADMIEGLIQRSFRASTGHAGPGREIRAEAERVAPEFDRLWGEGKQPVLSVGLGDRDQVVVSVKS